MALTYNADYLGDGKLRLLHQFQNKPRIASLLKAYLTEFQAIENAYWDLWISRNIEDATDDLLDILGKIVGQTRDGNVDDVYRVFIKIKIKVNKSDGRRETLIAIASLLGGGSDVYIKDYQIATVYIQPLGALIAPATKTVSLYLGKSVAAGVRLIFVWSGYADTNTLKLGSTYSLDNPTVNQSPGSYYSTPVGGGHLAGVINANE